MKRDIKRVLQNAKKDPKLAVICILAVIAVILALVLPNVGKTKTFDIIDKCGRFINLMSHTVEDEPSCKIRCMAKCESSEMKYKKIEFEVPASGCNKCLCHCR
jgi:hypothetical protein